MELLTPVYRQCAVAYTDFWAAYATVLPKSRHRAIGKQTGKTSYIERLNNTLSTKGISFGAKNIVFLQVVRESPD